VFAVHGLAWVKTPDTEPNGYTIAEAIRIELVS